MERWVQTKYIHTDTKIRLLWRKQWEDGSKQNTCIDKKIWLLWRKQWEEGSKQNTHTHRHKDKAALEETVERWVQTKYIHTDTKITLLRRKQWEDGSKQNTYTHSDTKIRLLWRKQWEDGSKQNTYTHRHKDNAAQEETVERRVKTKYTHTQTQR